MCRFCLATFILVALVGPSAGLEIEGGKTFKRDKMVRLKARGYAAKSALVWRYDKKKLDGARWGASKENLNLVGPPGAYLVELMAIRIGADGTTEVEEAELEIKIVEGDTPGPGPGPDPGPGPGPKPPEPKPEERPIAGPGSRVLIVYETGEVAKYPVGQVAAMQSKTVHQYLDSKCVVGADGKTKEWRVWDKDVNTTHTSNTWQDAMKRANKEAKSLPWIMIATDNQAGSYEGPLPADADKLKELLKKYLESPPRKARSVTTRSPSKTALKK